MLKTNDTFNGCEARTTNTENTPKYIIEVTSAYLFAILPDIAKFNDPIAHVIDVNNNGIIKHLSILNGEWEENFVVLN